AIDADHQIEGQLEITAALRQHPEDTLRERSGILGHCRWCDRQRTEIRRQGNGAGLGAVSSKVIEELLDRFSQGRKVSGILQGRNFLKTLQNLGLVEMENQIVGSQARHVSGRIESLERVVKIVGQKDLLEMRA